MPEEQRERIMDRIGNGKIIDKLFGQRLTRDNLTDEQKKLTTAFRQGLAQALGVPVENIREDVISNWLLNFTRAFVKPEHFDQTVMPPERQIKLFGQELGGIIRQSIEKLDKTEQVVEKPAEGAVAEKPARVIDKVKKRVEEFRSSISIDTT